MPCWCAVYGDSMQVEALLCGAVYGDSMQVEAPLCGAVYGGSMQVEALLCGAVYGDSMQVKALLCVLVPQPTDATAPQRATVLHTDPHDSFYPHKAFLWDAL